jgi:chaperonin GroES
MSRTTISDINSKLDIQKIQPISDFALVEVIERGASAYGIILPHKERSECCYSKVISVGTGTRNQATGESYPMAVQPGDLAISMQYAGDHVHAAGHKYRIVREHGFWAKVTMDLTHRSKPVTDLEPLSDHILVEFEADEKTLSGRLFLPSNPQTKLRAATVVKVGPGMRHLKVGAIHPMELKPGDRVICMRYSGAEVKVGGKDLRLMQQVDVKCIIEKDARVDIVESQPGDMAPADAADVTAEREATEVLKDAAERGMIVNADPASPMDN